MSMQIKKNCLLLKKRQKNKKTGLLHFAADPRFFELHQSA